MKNKAIAYLVIILAVWLLCLTSQESRAQLLAITPHELLPEQKIVIEGEETPPWKVLWDEARESALQGDFDRALRQYNALLVLKSNLQEARWELARILIYIKHWDEAAPLLELLIESVPDSTFYINALGKVMWEMEQYERAVALFKRAYEINPSDRTALAGLVEGMIKLTRKNEALPYLEQLIRQEPTNRGVRRYLANLLYETGNYEKARAHFTILARNEDVGVDVIYKTAKTYVHLGLERQAAIYWERVLGREPGNTEAHMFLAGYYEENGQLDRSLTHLEAILARNPEDTAIYARLGHTYEKAGEYDRAVSFYEKLLAENHQDQKIAQHIASINAAMGPPKKIPEPTPQPTAESDKKQTVNLQEAIRNLITAGRYQEAVPLYQQLIRISGDDPDILTALANDVIAIGQREGNDFIVKFLSDIAPDNMALYRALAELLRQMAREEEFLAVLGKIHEHDPGDNLTTQELAIRYLAQGNLVLSRKYFAELSDADCSNVRCLEARVSVAEKSNYPAHRLKDYEALLEMQSDRYEIRLAAIGIAAQLGLLDTALFHAGYLQNIASFSQSVELKILLADAYRESGYVSRAITRYRNVIDQTAETVESDVRRLRIRSWLGIADSYKKLGLVYEAEQTLRTALVNEERRIPLLAALFQLYLETGRIAESDIWLQAISRKLDEPPQDNLPKPELVRMKEFFQAEMYSGAGDYGLAIDLLSQAEAMLPEPEKNTEASYSADYFASGFRIRMNLAVNLFKAGEYEKAEKLVLTLKSNHKEQAEPLVLLEQIYRDQGEIAKAGDVSKEAERFASEDFGRQLMLTKLYDKYGNIAGKLASAEKAATSREESLAAKGLLIASRLDQGEYSVTHELLDQFLLIYPENTWFLTRKAELLAKMGNFQEALGVIDMILSENQERRDIIELQARIFWEMNRWKDSVALFESTLEPRIEDILERKIGKLAFELKQSQPKSTWWEKVTFSEGAPIDITEVVMSPGLAVDFSDDARAVNSLAANYYALYRWQKKLNKELSVKRSVMRREYYHAANKLEKYIEEFGSNDFLLYDLAGLYSKLDWLGDEAAVYKKLAAQNARFPGLAEATQRNNLKRRPQIYLVYRDQDEDGWEGYKSVRQKAVTGGWDYYRGTNQRWNIDISRINYESTRDFQNLRSWRTKVTYDLKLSQALGLTLGTGLEKPENDYNDTFLLAGSVTGKIADEMRAVFSVKQDVVTDTLASLKRNIIRNNYKIEFLFDLFPSLLLGGYFNFMDYSDSNWTNNYAFWASYILLPEPTSMKISYNYDFYDTREGYKPGAATDDGFAPNDHPYWCPINYWITQFTFNFKHQLSNDALARGVPSYYTIEYSLGYDSEDNDLHELKGSFNFEIAKNYTISASYGYLDLDEYQNQEFSLAVMYRF